MTERPRKNYHFSLTSVSSQKDSAIRSRLNKADYIFHLALRYICTVIFSLLLTKIVLTLNSINMVWSSQIPIQIIFLFFLLLVFKFYRISFLVFLGLLVSSLGIILLHLIGIASGLYVAIIQPIVNYFVTATRYFLGSFDASGAQINSYAIGIGLAILVLCSLGIYLSSHPWIMLVAIGTLLTVNFKEWIREDYILFFVGTVCMLLMLTMQKYIAAQNNKGSPNLFAPRSWTYKESGKRLLVAFLVTAIIIGAHAVIPRDFFYNSTIDRLLSRLTGKSLLKEDAIGYVEFSISEAGFYPLENRLGGPVDPTDSLYMYITTGPQAIYLRGAVFRDYTGTKWLQESMDQNWMFNHSRNKSIQSKIMGLTVDGLENSGSLQEPSFPLLAQDFSLEPIAEQQVIFNGGRINTIQYNESRDDVYAYFNPSGTMYADRAIPVEGYTVNGQIFQLEAIHNLEKLQSFQQGLGTMQKEWLLDTTDRTIWTDLYNKDSLLDFLQKSEPELFALVTDNSLAIADKALRLREWVADNIVYRMDVTEPPADEDFVIHVLKTKEGYCTYSGTLLAVLCRLAEIPARYVEGFVVQADPTAGLEPTTRSIAGHNAHAWTEIFLDEIGWLPIDGTPTEAQRQITGHDQIPESTPEPTPEPTPEETLPEDTEPDTDEEPMPDEPDTTDPDLDKEPGLLAKIFKTLWQILKIILRILLYLLPLILYVLWRKLVYEQRHDPAWLQKRFRDKPSELMLAIRQDLEQIWGLREIKQKTGDTLYMWFLSATDQSSHAARRTLDLIEQAIYSPGLTSLDEDDWNNVLEFYQAEEKLLKESIPFFKWLFRRFLWSRKHPL